MKHLTPLLASAAAIAALLSPARASACGGTFCEAPSPAVPAPMPVEQRGENILFSVRNGRVEAHIQIQYTGDPRYFGWVIPVPKVPSFRVGSQALFSALLSASVPTFDRNGATVRDDCGADSSSSSSDGGGCGSSGSDASDDSFTPSAAGTSPEKGNTQQPGEPEVDKQRVGAFEVAVLTGGTVEGVTSWLQSNGLQVDAKADPVLQDYLASGHVFVAVKLAAGVGLDEIHPIIVEYEGVEPCIPLKLTAIAAKEDMAIRALFLGEGRWVSDNYKHVVPNDALFDWVNLGSNYAAVVARAVDAEGTQGRAFVTEFAGRPTLTAAQRARISDPKWSSAPFVGAQATKVVSLLNGQGLMSCSSSASCVANHPLVLPLLRRWLPTPAGLSEAQYYAGLAVYAKSTPFMGAEFAADLDAEVIEPGAHALALIDGATTLTRLATAISPAEMTIDPTFIERTDLPAVSAARSAAAHVTCDGKRGLVLPSGREVFDPGSGAWPSLPAPAAERVEQHSPTGQAVVLADRKAEIDAAVADYDAAQGWPPPRRLDVVDGASSGGCAAAAVRGGRGFAWGVLLAAVALAARRRRGRG